MLDQGTTGVRRYGPEGEVHGSELGVHVRSFAPPPQMLIFGAIDFSAALARLAAELGYAVTICDPREAFARSPRFARHAEVRVAWPQDAARRAAARAARRGPRLHPRRQARRAGAGGGAGDRGRVRRGARAAAARPRSATGACSRPASSREALERLHAPCGLDLGGATPEEVAISILAEIVAERTGREGRPLRSAAGPIHAPRAE